MTPAKCGVIKILHFADAHIDFQSHGRQDAETGLPIRVLDFLHALDTIIDSAIKEKVDLVLFAGDAYKDRTPAPTYQREWGRRMMRLSSAGIPTILLIGNHDLSPSMGRANALQEFDTLAVPHVRVVSRPELLRPQNLEGLPLQIIAIPWITRSNTLLKMNEEIKETSRVFQEISAKIENLILSYLEECDPNLPIVLLAHTSVEGALYGAERSVLLGHDLTLSGSIVRNPRLDYVALGHIHKAQDLNSGNQPPVIYPGSIERVDFGEIKDDKYFVMAEISKGKTDAKFRKLSGRCFIDRYLNLLDSNDPAESIRAVLPPEDQIPNSICRLVIEYPRNLEAFIDEQDLRRYFRDAFEFHLIRKPRLESRLRLPENITINSLAHEDLVDLFWKSATMKIQNLEEIQKIASEIIHEVRSGE